MIVMGKRDVTIKENGAIFLIFLLVVSVHLQVTSQPSDGEAAAEAAPSPPQLPYSSLNHCPDHLIIGLLEALTCILPQSAAPAHEDGDLHSVRDSMRHEKVALAEALVLALLTSRNEKGTQWEIVFILIFPSAVCALLFCEMSLRNVYPRFVRVLEKLVGILMVNWVTALLLPADYRWVPLVCASSSLLSLIIVPFLP